MTDGLPLFPFSAQVSGKQQVQATPGRIWGYHLLNTTAALAYLQIFNKAAANVTLGTDTPDWVIPLAANGSAIVPPIGTLIARHGVAITIAGTTTRTGSTGAAVDVLLWVSN